MVRGRLPTSRARRANPVTGQRRSLRKISAELAAAGTHDGAHVPRQRGSAESCLHTRAGRASRAALENLARVASASKRKRRAGRRVHSITRGNVRQKARCRDDHRHITAQELSDPPVAIVLKGDPALVEGEIKGWGLSGRFGCSDIAYRPILFSRCAEMVLGGRQ